MSSFHISPFFVAPVCASGKRGGDGRSGRDNPCGAENRALTTMDRPDRIRTEMINDPLQASPPATAPHLTPSSDSSTPSPNTLLLMY